MIRPLVERVSYDGEVRDYAELACLGHVSRGRLTQIMKPTLLVLDIQETILFLLVATQGRDQLKEWQVRPIAAEPMWAEQRKKCHKESIRPDGCIVLCGWKFGPLAKSDTGAFVVRLFAVVGARRVPRLVRFPPFPPLRRIRGQRLTRDLSQRIHRTGP
ncbi:MAG TPA: hypothetical protein VK968_06225, partial [Roseimicrobium sp.]|nr:hypothetical protein [Roseimicrobium sp.]